ncbi:methyltransferase domain-containing protein [Halovivax limisalsi]|uniref:methyltransferase domain-containing protein n=1 Tax=Halovivax limisalsi TaxID=1453760 RepID=UPI001FFD17B6|nr:methyltransferase domain-containing protein [Halovivax limisalsi]
MSQQLHHTTDRPDLAGTLVCPDCSTRLGPGDLRCRDCETGTLEHDGVVSFRPDADDPPRWLGERDVEAFARSVADGSVRRAAREVDADDERRAAFLADVFDVRRELWQPLVAEHVGGRCLDLHAGFGRRSMVLADRAESVYAVDPSLANLRVAAARDDFDGADRVLPVHTTVDRLPFRTGSFDTIVADLSGGADVRSTLDRLTEYLAADGSLLVVADGWTRTAGLTDLLGLEGDRSAAGGDLRPGTAGGYRSLLRSLGFDDVTAYALVPSVSRPLYAFDVTCRDAIPAIFESYARDAGVAGRCVETAMGLLSRTGLLKRCYPSYLLACSNEPKPPAYAFSNPLVVAGRTRSVVLDFGSDGVDEIYKIPNSADHAPFTEREHRITSTLRATPAPIAASIPAGTTLDTAFGSARRVDPVAGRPLESAVDRNADSFERVLRIGLEWLADFHRSTAGDPIRRSPAAVREDLRLEPADVEPPAIDETLETRLTPVHGDFMAGNIYYEDGAVTSVIDWEYGARAASPVVDAGYLLLNTAAWIERDFEERVRTILCGDNEYARRARDLVRTYCDAVGLPSRTFEVYLPTAYLHQLAIDYEHESVSAVTTRSEEQVRRVRILFDAMDELTIAGGRR